MGSGRSPRLIIDHMAEGTGDSTRNGRATGGGGSRRFKVNGNTKELWIAMT
jgi:hypothetical protein